MCIRQSKGGQIPKYICAFLVQYTTNVMWNVISLLFDSSLLS